MLDNDGSAVPNTHANQSEGDKMTAENDEGGVVKDDVELLRPQLSFETITFSDDTKLTLDRDDIVVFVGPNNAGKSAALRDLEGWVANAVSRQVIKHATMRRVGTQANLQAYLNANAQKTGDTPSGDVRYGGIGYSIHQVHLRQFGSDEGVQYIAPFFAKRLSTETRLSDSNAAPGIALFSDPPTHPIHMLLMDQKLASKIGSMFFHAFGNDLTPFRAGGGKFPLYVGKKPAVKCGQDELSKEFVQALRDSNVPLEAQGDGMRSFAAVLLHVFAALTHSILFLDEPEAFLHPPQARLLGRNIAMHRPPDTQLFIATHSTDVLDGLIEGGSNKVRIVRLRREGSLNRVRELDKKQTATVAKDTLARFSRVFDGIFFEHVIICESDADCMFYQALLTLPSISSDRRPDVLFIHTAGKHRMAKLAEMLRALDVPVSVIADIDILNEKDTFRSLFETMGGEWNDVEKNWMTVSEAVTKKRPPLNAEQVMRLIRETLDDIEGNGKFPKEKEREIKEIFKDQSPWSALKQNGRSAVPGGEPTKNFDSLSGKCSDLRLWIVPVGEIEGFCSSVGSHGPRFVEQVLDERSLESDPELGPAREFVECIWAKAKLQIYTKDAPEGAPSKAAFGERKQLPRTTSSKRLSGD